MKLNKVVTGISALTLSAMLLTACSAKESTKDTTSSKTSSSKVTSSSKAATKTAGADLKDGTYKLEETGYSNGYRVKMSMTVKSGKVTKTTYDYVDKNGKSKTKDAEYEKNMKAKTKTGPAEFIPALNKSFTKNGDNIGAIETVSGATHSSLTFKNYALQLVEAAQKGDTATIKIDNEADMKDGTYALEEKNNNNGYHVTLSMTVQNKKITAVTYDQVNADGKSKKDDADYEKNMKAKNGVGPAEYIPQLEKSLLAADGDVSKVEVVSGATHSSDTFILYAEQLINAAQKGNTNKIEVDNIIFKD